MVPLPVSIGGENVWLPVSIGGEKVWLPVSMGGEKVWLPVSMGGEKVWLPVSIGGETVPLPVSIGGDTVTLPVLMGGETVMLPVSIGLLSVGETPVVITDCAELTCDAIDDATPCAEDNAEEIDARSEEAAVETAPCRELATDRTDEAALEAEPKTSLAALLMEPRSAGSVVGVAVGVPLITVSTPTVNAVVGVCVSRTSDATLDTCSTTELATDETVPSSPSEAVGVGVVSAGEFAGALSVGLVEASVVATLPSTLAATLDRVSPTLESTPSRPAEVEVELPKGEST